MMDDNSHRLDTSDLNIDHSDWITELWCDVDQQTGGNAGIDEARNLVSSSNANIMNQWNKNAVNLEEKELYRDTALKSDSMSSISQKMVPMESNSAPDKGLSQTATGEAVGHSSSLQNMSAYSFDSLGNPVGQGMHSNILPNTHWELPRSLPLQEMASQSCQNQQSRQQVLNQTVQQPNFERSLLRSNSGYSHENQQQKKLPAQCQSSQQSMFAAVPDQWKMDNLQNVSTLKRKPEPGLQNNILEKQYSPLFQHMSTSFQQPLGPQSNASELHQQQQMVGRKLDVFNMQTHQNPLQNLQQSEVTPIQQKFQQTSQQVQLHQTLGTHKQNNLFSEAMQQRLQTSATSFHPHTLMVCDTQNPLERSPSVFPEASSASVGSTTQTEHSSSTDWLDQAYQQIQSMREMYLPDLFKYYNLTNELCLQPHNAETTTKYGRIRIFINELIKFLQMPRADMTHLPKEKVYHNMYKVTWYVENFRTKNPISVQHNEQQLQQPGGQSRKPELHQKRETKFQFNPSSPGFTGAPVGSPPLSTRQSLLKVQASTINSLHNSSLTASETRITPSLLHNGLARSKQQYNLSSPQQTSLITSRHNGSQTGLEQRNPSPLQHGLVRSVPPNVVSMPQLTTTSQRTSANALNPAINHFPSNYMTTPLHPIMQQSKHQMGKTQKLKQPMQQLLIDQNKQPKFMQNMNEINDTKVGQAIGFNHRNLQNHHSIGLQADHLLLSSTPGQYPAASPQTSHHSSPQVDLTNLFTSFSKARKTTSQSTISSFIVPSPPAPLTPSSGQVDSHKHSSDICPLKIVENTKRPITPALPSNQAKVHNQSIATSTPEILGCPLSSEFTSLESSQQSHATGQPFKRLLEVVKSISPKVLSASLRDMGAVSPLINMRAGVTLYGESKYAIGQDLAKDIRYHLQSGDDFSLQYESTSDKRMNRHLSAMALDALSSPFNDNDSFECASGQVSEMESTATSRIKRTKIEPNKMLLQEIKKINLQLVETVLDVVLDASDIRSGAGEGTIVRCSYSALGLSTDFELQCALSEMLQNLYVRLLVPADYPNSSPINLDTPNGSSDSEGMEDLSQKAKSRFSSSLRTLPQPMSLGAMAKTWDACARSVFSELAERMGGGSFSSKYGVWVNCVSGA